MRVVHLRTERCAISCPSALKLITSSSNLLPMAGCEQFPPPARGGFVCLRQPAVIYCSVMCDNTSEFSTTPLNPYFCGRPSGSQWSDFTNRTYSQLPLCTGIGT